MTEEPITEEQLQAGERRPADHHHGGVEVGEESLADHLASAHRTEVPDGLSFSTMQGIHDRFHGEAHALDD